MKLDPIPALIATDDSVEKAIREAPNWSSDADKIWNLEKELEAARGVVEAARFVLDEADPRFTEDFTQSQTRLSESLKTYDEARRG